MNNGHLVWNNIIAYPDFEVGFLNEKSLFWRIESAHPFYTMINYNCSNYNYDSNSGNGKCIKINNYYHEPIIIRNGLWGSRIFLESEQNYTIGLNYKSNVRLYMGLYEHGSHTPLKNWVLNPTTNIANIDSNENLQWQDSFSLENNLNQNFYHNNTSYHNKTSCSKPLHLKIIIPDTAGEFVELSGLYLIESSLVKESPLTRLFCHHRTQNNQENFLFHNTLML
ncbi:MAG: hypothetical protein HQK67_06355 [Desulfamplus sp.]|nr:hypothetical protein [Desulfamplus sp.]